MSAPWTNEQAEQWAHECAGSLNPYRAFLAGLAKAAEIIKACPTVKTGERHKGAFDQVVDELTIVTRERDALLAAHRENADEDFRGYRSSASVRSYKAIKAHEARGSKPLPAN